MKMWSGGVCAAALAQTSTSDFKIGGKMLHPRCVMPEMSLTSSMEMTAAQAPAKK